MDFFIASIHAWYAQFRRDLPWRNTRDPYFIWLSEIILQQTRIDQGLSYYIRFTEKYPSVTDLADAPEDEVLKLWQGLGYYSRARNLLFSARTIRDQYNAQFPKDYLKIRSLKGIGDYTAAAIASISFDMEYPVVDGNVFRVLSRFFGIADPIDTTIGRKIFYHLAEELIKGTDPGMHNQALMEFGALQCVPRNPECVNCLLSERCFAYANGKINELPVKQNKTRQKERFFNYLVLIKAGHTFLRKRQENDIWRNLYEFPLVESSGQLGLKELAQTDEFSQLLQTEESVIRFESHWKIHQLTHQRIHYRFIGIELKGKIDLPKDLIKVNKEDIFNFAVPKLLDNFISENDFENLFT